MRDDLGGCESALSGERTIAHDDLKAALEVCRRRGRSVGGAGGLTVALEAVLARSAVDGDWS